MTFERPPAGPADWSQRYRDQDTPWDVGAPHPELARRIALREVAPPRPGATAFVPGAGFGHDALALQRAGFAVTAVDFAAGTADGAVADELRALGGHFTSEDALAFRGGPFDLVFEHTFFCALGLEDRPRWGELIARVLAPGGVVCAIVFPRGKAHDAGGPPWGTETAHLEAVLPDDFELEVDEPVRERLARREWEESWAVLRRRR